MGIYKLSFEAANGEVVDLPASMNKFTDVDALKAFAAERGYDSKLWSEDHDDVSRAFFKHATVRSVDMEAFSKNANLPINGDADYFVHGVNWKPFLDAVKEEPGLFELPEHVFMELIQNGDLNGIIDGNGKLVGTIKVTPKLVNGLRAKVDIEDEPGIQASETGAGWSAAPYRGLGLYTQFRREVLKSEGVDEGLIFSQALGKGASFVNMREGWALINPKEFPFATALMGWRDGKGYIGQQIQMSSGIKIDLEDRTIFSPKSSVNFAPKENGKIGKIAQRMKNNRDGWDKRFHLWTNNPAEVRKLELTLREKLRVSEKDNVSSEVLVHTYRGWLEAIEKTLFYKELEGHAKPTANWKFGGANDRGANDSGVNSAAPALDEVK